MLNSKGPAQILQVLFFSNDAMYQFYFLSDNNRVSSFANVAIMPCSMPI